MALTLRAQMKSLNGGIPMWLPQLAGFLADQGGAICIRVAREEAENSGDLHKKNHWHFLTSGLESINPTELATALEPLKEYPLQLRELEAQWSKQSKTLEIITAEWDLAASYAKKHILAWQKWASATVAAARKEAFPWTDFDWLDFSVPFEFSGATAALSSPQDLARNLDFFNDKVTLIRQVIQRSYVNGFFDETLSPADLDKAVRDLIDKQMEVIECEAAVAATKANWVRCGDAYQTHREPLMKLLWLMPESAHMALFWLCRPELEYQPLD